MKRKTFLGTIILLFCLVFLTVCSVSVVGGENNNNNEEEEEVIIYHTVFFFTDNNILYDEVSVQDGALVERPDENPQNDDENAIFVGWYETPNFTRKFNFNNAIYSSKSLYARFINRNYIQVEETHIDEPIENSPIFIEGRDLTIPNLFVCDHEVTQEEWSRFMKSHNLWKIGNNYPIYNVCWYECIMYCNLRSEAEGLEPAYYIMMNEEKVTDVLTWMTEDNNIDVDENGKFEYAQTRESKQSPDISATSALLEQIECDITASGYRIPTEAEWEFIARGGSANDATYEPLENYAWYKSTLHEVKQLQPNTLGIYDILGNVSEICYDRHGEITAETDIFGAEGLLCIRRGGCYVNGKTGIDNGKDGKKYPTGCNVDTRGQPKAPYEISQYGGLRVICTVNN